MSEIAIVNFLSSNATVIDLQNCITLGSYKNSAAKKHNVSLLRNELLLLGDSAKSLLHVFQLKKWEEELSCKIVLPAKPTAIGSSYGKTISFKCPKLLKLFFLQMGVS